MLARSGTATTRSTRIGSKARRPQHLQAVPRSGAPPLCRRRSPGNAGPVGVYTDHGSAALRKCFLERCRWEWPFCFENREELFPIHRSFKFAPIVDSTRRLDTVCPNRLYAPLPSDWERPTDHSLELTVTDIRRFAPATLSFMEFSRRRDLALVERMYGDH